MLPRHDVVSGVVGQVLEQPSFAFHQGAAEVLGREAVPRTGTMHHDEARIRVDPGEKRGRVAVAEQDLGVRPDHVVVEERQNARRPPAAPGEDALHVGVGEELHDVRRPLRVAASEITAAPVVVRSKPRFESHRPEGVREDLRWVGLEGSGGGTDDPERIPRLDSRRANQGRLLRTGPRGRQERNRGRTPEQREGRPPRDAMFLHRSRRTPSP